MGNQSNRSVVFTLFKITFLRKWDEWDYIRKIALKIAVSGFVTVSVFNKQFIIELEVTRSVVLGILIVDRAYSILT